MRFRTPFTALACILVAACAVRSPEPTPAPPAARPSPEPAPLPAPTPVPTQASWIDAPQTPGDWFYRRGGGTTRALFGDAGAEARFALTCDPARRSITLARAGDAPGARQIVIRTEFADRGLPAAPGTSAAPSIEARVAAGDPLLDAMAFSKGRFAVEVAGLEPLYLPSWPEVTRVIEDCRR